jgi:phospholipase C
MKIDRRRFLGMGLASAALGGCANSARGPRSPLSIARLGGEIQHLVVLMMENRSYDQMLGALPGRKYAGPPPHTTVSYRSEHGLVDVPLRHGRPHDAQAITQLSGGPVISFSLKRHDVVGQACDR